MPLAVATAMLLVACALAMSIARIAGAPDVVLTGPLAKVAQIASGSLLPTPRARHGRAPR